MTQLLYTKLAEVSVGKAHVRIIEELAWNKNFILTYTDRKQNRVRQG